MRHSRTKKDWAGTRPQRRPIAPERDRIQSRVLAGAVGTLLAAGCLNLIRLAVGNVQGRSSFWVAVGVSLTLGLVVWALRAATPAAAIVGSAICLLLASYSPGPGDALSHSALVSLLALFTLTFGATRLGHTRKQALRLAEADRGRNAAQVIANLGAAGLISAFTPAHSLFARVLLLAALAESTADTLASEIGQAFGGIPRLIPRLQPVVPGTDGAITLLGTFAGLTGAAILCALGSFALRVSGPTALVALTAANAGLFFDSLLGASVERHGWLNNDLVNFTSDAFAIGCAALLLSLW